ncbi:protein odr-4 homolog [Diadema antillarum]|uniref:protein odr-4 homolog n=1 Tax=Diadema antillarum TaxID=105358 RepID=UPI003A8B5A34
MGKTIYADTGLQDAVSELSSKKGVIIGLLIGKCASQKDTVVYLVPTPSEQSGDSSHGNPSSVDSYSEQWIAEHARQVTCTLPGGIGITGVFYSCQPGESSQGAIRARQALFATFKLLTKRRLMTVDQGRETLDWCALHICQATKKTVCKTFNVLDHKCTARPADLKFQSNVQQWAVVQSSLRLNVGVHLGSAVADCSQYSKQLLARLHPVSQMIEDASALVDGQLRRGSDPLEGQPAKKKGGKKGGGGARSDGGVHTVELLTGKNDISVKSSSMEQSSVKAHILITGVMTSKAYVDQKATVNDAEQAVKEDLLRSVHARFDLLTDDLRQNAKADVDSEEGRTAPPAMIVTPRRVYARLPNSPIIVSDYAFAEEEAGEVAERLSELLDIKVNPEELDLEAESLPGSQRRTKAPWQITRSRKTAALPLSGLLLFRRVLLNPPIQKPALRRF